MADRRVANPFARRRRWTKWERRARERLTWVSIAMALCALFISVYNSFYRPNRVSAIIQKVGSGRNIEVSILIMNTGRRVNAIQSGYLLFGRDAEFKDSYSPDGKQLRSCVVEPGKIVAESATIDVAEIRREWAKEKVYVGAQFHVYNDDGRRFTSWYRFGEINFDADGLIANASWNVVYADLLVNMPDPK